MSETSRESADRLAAAVEAYRSTELRYGVLLRAESRILDRAPVAKRIPVRALLWLAGAAVASSALLIAFAPAKSYAAEIRRIALNGDSSFRHILYYDVQPDGSLKLGLEEFASGLRHRMIDMGGNQYTYGAGPVEVLHIDGAATIETQGVGRPQPVTASQILAGDAQTRGVSNMKTSVRRGILLQGKTVNEYTEDSTMIDGQRTPRQMHVTLFADPGSELPLEIDENISGFGSWVRKFDYPAADPKLLELPTKLRTRIYDLDAERASIRNALASHGLRQTVGGKTVDFLQLWVDERGRACAIARASYPYPENYGIHIDDLKTWDEPEEEPFSGRYLIHQPIPYKGGLTQIFVTPRSWTSGSVPYPKRVTLRIPVFAGKRLAGYAKFEDVPVNWTYDVYGLLRPQDLPFWSDEVPELSATGSETAAATEPPK